MAKRMMADESFCIYCQREHLDTEFFKSNNPFYKNGRLPYCKDAVKEIFNYYLNQTKVMETSIWLTCSQVGVPFIKKAFDMFQDDINEKKRPKDYNFMGLYIAKLNLIESGGKQKKYKDFSATDVNYGEVNNLRTVEDIIHADYQGVELDWGQQSAEDYAFLENLYAKYTEDLDLDSQQEDLYRDLCLARLRKRKLEFSIDDGDVDEQALSKVQNQIFSIMNKLKIDDFEKAKKSPVDQLIFERIKMVEETMPCENPDKEKYKDVTGIGRYMKDLIFRPMLNTLVGSRDFNVRDVKEYDIE